MTELDTGKPNPARIYDYMLGGSHNFEADRAAGERLRAMVPSIQNVMRLNRWFMHDVVARMAAEKFDGYLDLASGIPTEGYVHELVPDAKVLYNDRDPVTVDYARQILGDNPNVRYNQSDLNNIEALLDEACGFFGDNRHIGICFVGVAYFLEDTVVRNILNRLYEWAAPGSMLAMTWILGDPDHPVMAEAMNMYAKMGSPMTIRSLDTVHSLLERWTIQDPGIIQLNKWLDLGAWDEPGASDSSIADMYGVIVQKSA
jgi:hypothetical protein